MVVARSATLVGRGAALAAALAGAAQRAPNEAVPGL
jgi:hypothetical protein